MPKEVRLDLFGAICVFSKALLSPISSFDSADGNGNGGGGSGSGGPIDSCTEQENCSSITIVEEEGGCSSAGCEFKVCLSVDTSTSNTQCTKTGSISHYCKAGPDGDETCSEPGSWGTNYDSSVPEVFEQCLYAGPGETVEFVLKDGGGCNDSISPFALTGGGVAECGATESQTCSGNGNIGKECLWKITTPECSEEEFVVITPSPTTPSPTECPIDTGTTGDEICPDGPKAVSLLETETASGDVVPAGYNIEDIIYNLNFDVSNQVSFQVDNPFSFDVDIYVQYQKPVGESGLAGDAVCSKSLQQADCDVNSAVLEAVCVEEPNVDPFTIVTVAFVSNDSSIVADDSGEDIYECCHLEDGTDGPNYGTLKYTFKVLCGCPKDERRLRGQNSKDPLVLWNKHSSN